MDIIYTTILDLLISLFPVEVATQLTVFIQLSAVILTIVIVVFCFVLPIIKLFRWICGY